MAAPIGDIAQNCNSDDSLLVFFQLSNPAGGAPSVTGQMTIAGTAFLDSLTAPAGQSANGSTTLPPGYTPGGQAAITVNQVPIKTVTIVDCTALNA